MKLLVLLFLVGYAAASTSFYDVLDQAADEIVYDFMVGMDSAPSLKRSLGFEDDEESDFAFALAEEDIKTELGKKLREALDKLLEKVKDSIEQGKAVKSDLIEKLKDLKEKMKDLKIDIGERAKDLLGKIKGKAKDFLKKILDQFDFNNKDENLRHIDFNIKSIFKKLKKAILGNINKEELKANIEKFFGKGSELAEQLLNMLKEKGEKGKKKILDIIDKILKEDEEEEQFAIRHSIKDMWEKVKNYFKDLNIDLKEKFAKFGEWVKDTVKKGIDKSKTKLENIKAIAIEFKKHAKEVSKEVAVEALEFLRPYKDDLGELWQQVKDSVKEVINRKDY